MTRHRSTKWIVVLAAAAVVAGGCVPKKRVAWSPDGRRAAVIGYDGLYLCDAQGALSKLRVPGARHAEWAGDSRTLVLAVETPIDSWDKAVAGMKPGQAERIRAAAEALRTEVLAYTGSFEKYEPVSTQSLTNRESVAAILYLRDQHPDGLREKFGAEWDKLSKATVDGWTIERYDVEAAEASARRVIAQEFDLAIETIRPSPDGKFVAFVENDDTHKQSDLSLHIAPVDGKGGLTCIAPHVSMFPDWSPDGRHVIYIAANGPSPEGSKNLQLGTLCRRQVRDESGALLAGKDGGSSTTHPTNAAPAGAGDAASSTADLAEMPQAEELAGVLFEQTLRVRSLPDGQVLFASLELHLPATAHDMPQRGSLFCVDPARRATVARVMPRDAESAAGDGLSFFELSPDGRRVLIPDCKGALGVLELASGNWMPVQQAGDSGDLATIPTWRIAEELCYSAPAGTEHGSPQRAEIVLRPIDGAPRTISRAWPAGMAKEFLIPQKQGPQSAPEAAAEPMDDAPKK